MLKKTFFLFYQLDCADLGSLGNGQIQRSLGNSHQSVATFTCNDGYNLKGSGTRKCQAGVWTNSNPVCEIIGKGQGKGFPKRQWE